LEKQKISLHLVLDRPAFSPVTIPTTQSRFATPVFIIRLYIMHAAWFMCVTAVFTNTYTWLVLITHVMRCDAAASLPVSPDIVYGLYQLPCTARFFLMSTIPKCKKAAPLQAWSGPEGSMKLRFPDFMTTAQEGGKVVSLTHRPNLPPGNSPGTHFF